MQKYCLLMLYIHAKQQDSFCEAFSEQLWYTFHSIKGAVGKLEELLFEWFFNMA